MVSRRFHAICILRVCLLSLTICLLAYLLFKTTLYASMVVTLLLIIYQVYALMAFVEKANRSVTGWLESIQFADFADGFSTGLHGRGFDELNAAFAQLTKRFRDLRQDREEHARYLQTVVQHIGIGLVAFRENGEVELLNNAARRLFSIATLKNIDQLHAVSPDLVEHLRTAVPGPPTLLAIKRPHELMQLSILTTRLHLRDRRLTLASFQNISYELSAREMEAWQNLIRVLTHEIRNSLTPISSLATTVEEMIGADSGPNDTRSAEFRADVREALATIRKRSDGLLGFVDSYRRLTRLPKPVFRTCRVGDLLQDTVQLVMPQFAAAGIHLDSTVEPVDLEIYADPQLVEQVLLNLLTNAAEALSGQADGRIMLVARHDPAGRVAIMVSDNGPGIVPDAIDQVFVPFFTTKKGGTGIGLNFSQQIMRLHQGALTVVSVPGKETTFTMLF